MNSRGFGPNRETLSFHHGNAFDFCLVQETLCSDKDVIAGLSSHWRRSSYWSPAIGKQGDVLSWRKDTEGRILSLLVNVDNFKFNLLNIYASTNPTSTRVFFNNLHPFLSLLMLSSSVAILIALSVISINLEAMSP